MTSSVSEVQQAVESLRKAMIAFDRDELTRLTVEGLVFGHASGRTETRQQFMDALGKRGFSEIVISDQQVTVTENVAVVSQMVKRTSQDGSDMMKELAVWLLSNGQWKLVARQSVKK